MAETRSRKRLKTSDTDAIDPSPALRLMPRSAKASSARLQAGLRDGDAGKPLR